jgi:hypothetical protein
MKACINENVSVGQRLIVTGVIPFANHPTTILESDNEVERLQAENKALRTAFKSEFAKASYYFAWKRDVAPTWEDQGCPEFHVKKAEEALEELLAEAAKKGGQI